MEEKLIKGRGFNVEQLSKVYIFPRRGAETEAECGLTPGKLKLSGKS